MLSLLRSMENSSSQELLVRLSRMVENDRRIELVSVTTCKQPRQPGERVSSGQGWGGRWSSNYWFLTGMPASWMGRFRVGGWPAQAQPPPPPQIISAQIRVGGKWGLAFVLSSSSAPASWERCSTSKASDCDSSQGAAWQGKSSSTLSRVWGHRGYQAIGPQAVSAALPTLTTGLEWSKRRHQRRNH